MSMKNNTTNEEGNPHILPWTREGLEKLVKGMITMIETPKVDFKAKFDFKNKGEFLKDISAMANTYSDHCKNYGFIVYGISEGGFCYTEFPNGADHSQAAIDNLIDVYIGPFINTHLFIFKDNLKEWGVLVIPPTKAAPHTFIKETHDKYVGDIYVRTGTTTRKAISQDYSRFSSERFDDYSYEIKQNIENQKFTTHILKERVEKMEQMFEQNSKSNMVSIDDVLSISKNNDDQNKSVSFVSKNLNEFIGEELHTRNNAILAGLLREARKINAFLDSDDIPWELGAIDKKKSTELLFKIEEVSTELWLSIANLVLLDEEGKCEDVLVQAVSSIARHHEPPSVASEWAVYIRYFPLFIVLKIVSIIGVAKGRTSLLNKIFKIEFRNSRGRYSKDSVCNVLFDIRYASTIFQHVGLEYPKVKLRDPVATYARGLLARTLNTNDLFWNTEEEYYEGEFVLCLSPLDKVDLETKKPIYTYPSSGLYAYFNNAKPIITRFLKTKKEFLSEIFERPLMEILSDFDATPHKFSGESFTDGFTYGALKAAGFSNEN